MIHIGRRSKVTVNPGALRSVGKANKIHRYLRGGDLPRNTAARRYDETEETCAWWNARDRETVKRWRTPVNREKNNNTFFFSSEFKRF